MIKRLTGGIILIFVLSVFSILMIGVEQAKADLAPAVPVNLKTKVISENRIDLSWSKMVLATSYEVQGRAEGDAYPDWSTTWTTNSCESTGLTAGTKYYYRVRSVGATQKSAWSSEVSATTLGGALSAPYDLRVTNYTEDEIDLKWKPVNGADFYEVQGRAKNESYPSWDTDWDTYACQSTGLTEGTKYYYRVRAVSSSGKRSDWSSEVAATTKGGTLSAPTGLEAEPFSETRIDLTWDKVNGADFYEVQGIPRGESYPSWDTDWYNNSCQSSGLTAGTEYRYHVRAVKGAVRSEWSDEAFATTQGGTLPAPTGLEAEPVSNTEIGLTWDTVNGADYYEVQSTPSGESYPSGDTDWYNNSCQSTGLTAGMEYKYHVRAVKGAVRSAWSDEVSATTQGGTLSAPTGLEAVPVSDNQIDLKWDAMSGADSYEVQVRAENEDFADPGFECSSNSFESTGLTAGIVYYYHVRAVKGSERSEWSEEVSATIQGEETLSSPTSLNAEPVSDTEIDLEWDSVSGAEYYEVQVRAENEDYTDLDFDCGSNSFESTGLMAGIQYYFHVCAVKGTERSAWSDEVSAATIGGTTRNTQTVISFTVNSSEYLVNNQMMVMDTLPIIRGSRLMLPIRYLATPLGASIGWNGGEQKVTISLDGKVIELWIDQATARVNGQNVQIDPSDPSVTPIIYQDRTLLPLRFISENLGCRVDWDSGLMKATVTYPQ